MRNFLAIRKPRRDARLDEYRFLGLDEAGRGPVIGPMVIAICALTPRDRRWCYKHGVTDSKKLRPKIREKLADALRERCWHKTVVIQPPEIDAAVKNPSLNLNGLEIKYMSQLIKDYLLEFPESPAEVMLDAPVRSVKNFLKLVSHLSGWKSMDTLMTENKADLHYRHVGAASIIAKTIRDAHVRKIIYELNENIGSGYSSDKLAREYVARAKENDPNIRWSWATCKNVRDFAKSTTKPLL